MALDLKVKIITPEEVAYDDMATAVTIPAEMGEIQVLAGHILVVARIVSGKIVVFKDGIATDEFNVEEGFFRITKDEVSILIDKIIDSKKNSE